MRMDIDHTQRLNTPGIMGMQTKSLSAHLGRRASLPYDLKIDSNMLKQACQANSGPIHRTASSSLKARRGHRMSAPNADDLGLLQFYQQHGPPKAVQHLPTQKEDNTEHLPNISPMATAKSPAPPVKSPAPPAEEKAAEERAMEGTEVENGLSPFASVSATCGSSSSLISQSETT
eukprot:155887-Rhodomonas_salina.1